jgi:hypothetical protein
LASRVLPRLLSRYAEALYPIGEFYRNEPPRIRVFIETTRAVVFQIIDGRIRSHVVGTMKISIEFIIELLRMREAEE